MDKFVQLSQDEARQLLQELQSVVDAKGTYGIYKLSVYVGSEGAKFKINEYMWSPPMGKVVEGS